MNKIKMCLNKKDFLPANMILGVTYTNIENMDMNALSEGFLDAYKGTIDDEGEDIEDTKSFLKQVMENAYGTFLPNFSLALFQDETLISGILYALEDDTPFIVSVFTRSQYKGLGYAEALIRYTLNLIFEKHSNILLYVSEGNPAMHLYEKIGFYIMDL
jgi:ribosomal protein S18 acetylase RimI-like enzyme